MDKQKVIDRVVMLIAVVAVVFGGYFYYQWSLLKQNPQAVAQQETTDLMAKVGKLLVLPEGETPTVATVSDPEALKDQAFFTKATKGDKVLIYTTAKKAILYSVTLNKILEVAPLNIGEGQKAVTPKPATTTTTTTENPN
jgi:myo-inositol-hexaphosphate 3-phosphohydrolase